MDLGLTGKIAAGHSRQWGLGKAIEPYGSDQL